MFGLGLDGSVYFVSSHRGFHKGYSVSPAVPREETDRRRAHPDSTPRHFLMTDFLSGERDVVVSVVLYGQLTPVGCRICQDTQMQSQDKAGFYGFGGRATEVFIFSDP